MLRPLLFDHPATFVSASIRIPGVQPVVLDALASPWWQGPLLWSGVRGRASCHHRRASGTCGNYLMCWKWTGLFAGLGLAHYVLEVGAQVGGRVSYHLHRLHPLDEGWVHGVTLVHLRRLQALD